ncbi:MAG: enolase C-terminal domain-like protein [Halobacteriaceae archaeon]
MTEFDVTGVSARQILDCRLEPTLRVTVETPAGTGTADVPAGRSTGRHEAVELRDGGPGYAGKGVERAVGAVEDALADAVRGVDVRDQRALDRRLAARAGPQKERLGGNATTGVSLAALRAAAAATDAPLYRTVGGAGAHVLPAPVLDYVEGGELAATELAFQEHQAVPVGADSFAEAIRWGAEVYYELGDVVADRWGRGARNVGVEGGYTPAGVDDPRDAFDAILAAVEECGYGGEFVLSIDAAATHFYDADADAYRVAGDDRDAGELLELYADLAADYPLASIEDPFHEDDFEAFARATDRLDCQIVGDDLFVTQADRVARGVEAGAATALLLKVNQAGTVTEALDAARTATEAGYAVQVSERSGQTPDTWLADLAVGLDAGQIKTGVSRGERVEQYNRLLAIEAEAATAYGGDALAGYA